MTVIRARAPMRVSLAGGGSDLPAYYEATPNNTGGHVLNAAIAQYAWATVTPGPWRSSGVAPDVADAVIAELRDDHPDQPFHLHLELDAPLGSGLGGSSALVVAAVAATSAFVVDDVPSGPLLAEIAWCLERGRMRQPGGVQDQLAAAHGGVNMWHITRSSPGRAPYVARHVIDPACLDELQYRLLLAPAPGAPRWSGERVVAQSRTLTEQPAYGDSLVAITHDLYTNLTDWDALPRALNACHNLKIQLDPAAVTPAITEAISTYRSCGATACKLTGAGGGGHLLLYVPTPPARAACIAAGASPIVLDAEGAVVWEC